MRRRRAGAGGEAGERVVAAQLALAGRVGVRQPRRRRRRRRQVLALAVLVAIALHTHAHAHVTIVIREIVTSQRSVKIITSAFSFLIYGDVTINYHSPTLCKRRRNVN